MITVLAQRKKEKRKKERKKTIKARVGDYSSGPKKERKKERTLDQMATRTTLCVWLCCDLTIFSS